MVDVDASFDEISEQADMLMSEFKEFIAKGNVIDLAVGTIMGGMEMNIPYSLEQVFLA